MAMISSGKLVIEVSQNSKFENLQSILTNHVQSYYLNKKVLSIEEDAVNYRFTLDLTQILSALVEHDDAPYTYTDEMIGEVREYDRSLRISVRSEWQLAHIERFWNTERSHYLQPYVTKKNALAFLLDRELSLKHYVNYKVVRKIRLHTDCVAFEDFFDTLFFPLADCHLVIVERSGKKTFQRDFDYHLIETKYARVYRYAYKIELTMAELSDYLKQLDQSNELGLDLFFIGHLAGTDVPLKFRIGNSRFITKYTMRGELALKDPAKKQWLSLYLYFTIKGLNLSFTFNAYQEDAYAYFRAHRHRWRAVAKQAAGRDIWIIGERSLRPKIMGSGSSNIYVNNIQKLKCTM
ncbi:hypothetical protein FD48_GL001513 [Lactiplantibacillus paraplantarum DSM 10667]|nr:hypothetical protein FD48_GL001513 [Lactiplantibacillus paraplantarum DSM 10667]